MENISSQEETSTGVLDHDAVLGSLEALTKKKKRRNSTFSDEERYQFGQYPSADEPTAAVRRFMKPHPHLKFGECTARSLEPNNRSYLRKKKSNLQRSCYRKEVDL